MRDKELVMEVLHQISSSGLEEGKRYAGYPYPSLCRYKCRGGILHLQGKNTCTPGNAPKNDEGTLNKVSYRHPKWRFGSSSSSLVHGRLSGPTL